VVGSSGSVSELLFKAGVSNIRPAGHNPARRAFPSGPTRPTDTVQHEKYSELVARLIGDFQQRFEDFRKHTDIMKLLNDPFQVDPIQVLLVKYQTELTDIQNDGDLKRAFSEQDLLSFDSAVIIIYRLFFLFHQTVAPICCRMPRISLLCLVEPTAKSNCFRE